MSKPHLRNVLVVEDDIDIREALQEVLEVHGYVVLTASHGGVALEKLTLLQHPCVILLDLMMPVMDGFQFLEVLERRGEAHEWPVVVLSANRDIERARTLPGVASVLSKPFELDDLLERVKRFCV